MSDAQILFTPGDALPEGTKLMTKPCVVGQTKLDDIAIAPAYLAGRAIQCLTLASSNVVCVRDKESMPLVVGCVGYALGSDSIRTWTVVGELSRGWLYNSVVPTVKDAGVYSVVINNKPPTAPEVPFCVL